jgi:hypothetical protein
VSGTAAPAVPVGTISRRTVRPRDGRCSEWFGALHSKSPWKPRFEKLYGLRAALGCTDDVLTPCSAAIGVIANSTASDGNNPSCTATNRNAADGRPTEREQADRQPGNANQPQSAATNGDPADCYAAERQNALCDPSNG